MVSPFIGATLVFEDTSWAKTVPMVVSMRKYTTAPYAFSLASANPWS